MRASSSTSVEPFSERILGLDLIRFFSFSAILIFHLTYALWGRLGHTEIPVKSAWVQPLETYARALAGSGFYVLFISFFLYGLRPSRKWVWLPVCFCAFFVLWNGIAGDWSWDVYPFLFITLLVLGAGNLARARGRFWIFIGGVLLLTPFWNMEEIFHLPLKLESALWGVCTSRPDLGDWPLLPWIGYPMLAFGLGKETRSLSALQTWRPAESFIWPVLLAAALPQLSKYYVTPLGDGFGCFIFRRPWFEFLALQIFLIFAIRVSLLRAVQSALGDRKWVCWISRRQINRHFFAAYGLHYPLCLYLAGLAFSEGLLFHPLTLLTAFVIVFTAVECACVALFRLIAHTKARRGYVERSA